MSAYLPTIAGIGTFIAIYLAALVATVPFRRWARRGVPAPPSLLTYLKYLAARISLPLAVLVLTRLAFWLLRLHPPVFDLVGRPAYVSAWYFFWSALLALNLLEGLALQVFAFRNLTFPVPALLRNIIRFVILIAVLFLLLRTVVGLDISPLLASTALLTAVVGFALQGVLGNLLAGMSLHLTRSVLPSDWVAIGDVEGKVIETNWRETRLRTVGGHTIVVPNSTVAESLLHNLNVPTPLRRHEFHVGASYSDAPGEVIEALLEAAASVSAVKSKPPPSAYVTEYKDYGIDYVLRYWTDRYQDRAPIDGDVGRMIWYKFKRRGIEIPFPMSDKLLNDFMAVVYRQRRLAPEETEVKNRAAKLAQSDLLTELLVDQKGSPLLGEEELLEMARSLRPVIYTQGEVLFRQGEAGENCFVVVRGKLDCRVEYEDAAEANRFEIGPGALVGEMSLMTGLPRTATVEAAEEVELLEMGRDAFVRLLSLREEIPEILAGLVAARAEKNAAAMEKLKSLKPDDVSRTLKKENIFQRFLGFLHR